MDIKLIMKEKQYTNIFSHLKKIHQYTFSIHHLNLYLLSSYRYYNKIPLDIYLIYHLLLVNLIIEKSIISLLLKNVKNNNLKI